MVAIFEYFQRNSEVGRRKIIQKTLHGCVNIKYRKQEDEHGNRTEADDVNIGSGFYFTSDNYPGLAEN